MVVYACHGSVAFSKNRVRAPARPGSNAQGMDDDYDRDTYVNAASGTSTNWSSGIKWMIASTLSVIFLVHPVADSAHVYAALKCRGRVRLSSPCSHPCDIAHVQAQR
jgi:hypothetical protein